MVGTLRIQTSVPSWLFSSEKVKALWTVWREGLASPFWLVSSRSEKPCGHPRSLLCDPHTFPLLQGMQSHPPKKILGNPCYHHHLLNWVICLALHSVWPFRGSTQLPHLPVQSTSRRWVINFHSAILSYHALWKVSLPSALPCYQTSDSKTEWV